MLIWRLTITPLAVRLRTIDARLPMSAYADQHDRQQMHKEQKMNTLISHLRYVENGKRARKQQGFTLKRQSWVQLWDL